MSKFVHKEIDDSQQDASMRAYLSISENCDDILMEKHPTTRQEGKITGEIGKYGYEIQIP